MTDNRGIRGVGGFSTMYEGANLAPKRYLTLSNAKTVLSGKCDK